MATARPSFYKPPAIDEHELISDFQRNAFSFARIRVTGSSIEDALLKAVDVVAGTSEASASYAKDLHRGVRAFEEVGSEPEERQEQPSPVDAPDLSAIEAARTMELPAPIQPDRAADLVQREAHPEPAAADERAGRAECGNRVGGRAEATIVATAEGPLERDGFGDMEEGFFDSYVPPEPPMSKNEMLALADPIRARIERRKRKRSFMGWLAALWPA